MEWRCNGGRADPRLPVRQTRLGQGYGGEPAASVMAEAERRGHARVESSAYPKNTASDRILLRLGVQLTAMRPAPADSTKRVQWYVKLTSAGIS